MTQFNPRFLLLVGYMTFCVRKKHQKHKIKKYFFKCIFLLAHILNNKILLKQLSFFAIQTSKEMSQLSISLRRKLSTSCFFITNRSQTEHTRETDRGHSPRFLPFCQRLLQSEQHPDLWWNLLSDSHHMQLQPGGRPEEQLPLDGVRCWAFWEAERHIKSCTSVTSKTLYCT